MRNARLCLGTRGPVNAGRSPYKSEPWFEARNPTTPTGGCDANPPVNAGAVWSCISGRRPGPRLRAPRRLAACAAWCARPEWDNGRSGSLPAALTTCGSGDPTQVSVPDGAVLAVRSQQSPASCALSGLAGCRSAMHLARSSANPRHLRVRSRNSCKQAGCDSRVGTTKP
jgi:hypothetical protein